MTKLSDTQAVSSAPRPSATMVRSCRCPRPSSSRGGALTKVLGSLEAKGLIEHQGAPRGDDPPPLRITRAGLEAIGVAEDEPDSTPVPATDAPQGAPDAQEAGTAGQEPQAPAEPAQAATAPAAAKGKAKATQGGQACKAGQGAPADKPTPRAGTKQAR